MGQLAIDPILAAYKKELTAKDSRDGVVFRSLLLMGEIPCDKSRDALLEALKTSDGPRAIAIRHHAAIALGLLQDKLAIEPLIDAYEREREFRVGMAIDRSLAWLTNEQSVAPQAYRWKAWWAANKDRFFPPKADKYDDIYIPKGGVAKPDEKK
jgi:HEAT repeat protein